MSDVAEPVEAAPAVKKKRGGYITLMGVMVVMVAVIIIMITQRQPAVRGAAVGDVQITITAPRPNTKVVVDGAPAGTTPLVLRMKSSDTPIKIIGNNVAIVVTPNRDHTVNLVPRKKQP